MSNQQLKMKSMIELIIEDFETQNWKICAKAKEKLLKESVYLYQLYFCDFLISHLLIGTFQNILECTFYIIGPSVVAFWRGTWDYSRIWLETDLLGGDSTLTNLLCLSFGLLVTGLVDIFHVKISWMAGPVGSIRHALIRHVFSFCWGVADIFLWKGIWDGYDNYFGLDIYQAVVTLSIGLFVLTCTRSLKSGLSVPVSTTFHYKLLYVFQCLDWDLSG